MAQSPDEQAVVAANERFYQALDNMDIHAMDAVWLPDAVVACIHPGWERLQGWDAVRASWVRIFQHTQMMRLVPTEVSVRVMGDVAWVTCTEQITTFYESGLSSSIALATNIFVRRGTEWRMVVHHTSPGPVNEA